MVVALVKNKPGEAAEKDRDNSRRTVLESIMKRDVYTLPANATVAEAMQVLVDRHISAAPLVDEQARPWASYPTAISCATCRSDRRC